MGINFRANWISFFCIILQSLEYWLLICLHRFFLHLLLRKLWMNLIWNFMIFTKFSTGILFNLNYALILQNIFTIIINIQRTFGRYYNNKIISRTWRIFLNFYFLFLIQAILPCFFYGWIRSRSFHKNTLQLIILEQKSKAMLKENNPLDDIFYIQLLIHLLQTFFNCLETGIFWANANQL